MRIYLCAVLILSLGCASSKKRESTATPAPDSRVMVEFEKGLKYLEEEKYEMAARTLDQLLVDKPASEFDLVVSFNAAAAREGMKDCKGAAERYRRIFNVAKTKFEPIANQALYRLSYAYECLGADAKVISSLLDLRKKTNGIAEDISLAEIPARLAAAYARVENRDLSLQYYDLANQGLNQLRVNFRSRAKYDDVMARTLFYMGRLTLPDERAKVKPKAYLENVRALQPYLVQAVIMDVPTWSQKSYQQLSNAYARLWDYVEQVKSSETKDVLLKEVEDRNARLAIAREAMISLGTLRKMVTTVPIKPQSVPGEMLQFIDGQDKRFQSLLSANAVTTLPSLESQKRHQVK